jgi:hypothetical protein
LQKKSPNYVFLAAAKVGGIGANSTYLRIFFYQPGIALNVIVARLIDMG